MHDGVFRPGDTNVFEQPLGAGQIPFHHMVVGQQELRLDRLRMGGDEPLQLADLGQIAFTDSPFREDRDASQCHSVVAKQRRARYAAMPLTVSRLFQRPGNR